MRQKTTNHEPKKTRGQRLADWAGSWALEWERQSAGDRVLFVLLLFLYSAVTLYLFVMQCYEIPNFVSDMPDYVDKVRGIAGRYEFPYPLFFTVARLLSFLCGAPVATAMAAMLLNGLGIWIARGYVGGSLRASFPKLSGGLDSARLDVSATLLTFALFLLGNLYSPKNTAFFGFDYAYRCMGIYTPNPIWNATYLAARPFALICFFEGCRMLTRLDDLWRQRHGGFVEAFFGFPWRESLPFALSLLLTTLTKPSFTIVIVPTLGILLLAQLIESRGRSLPCAAALCAVMVPTGLDLLFQFFGVFSGTNTMGEETGIGFAFAAVWSNYSKNIPLSILMGMALPIGVLLLNGKEFLKNRCYRVSWYVYLVATGMFLCLYEKGFRMLHANFSWGYMYGMFFVFLMTLVVMIQNTVQWRKSFKMVFVLAEWGVFFYHLVCGVNFLLYALQGKELAGF